MSTTRDILYVRDIYERITRIETFVAEGKEVFLQSLLVQDAVIRNFEVIGEAANHLSQEFHQNYPQVPLVEIISFRNLLIHGYDQVSPSRVWDIIPSSGKELDSRKGAKAQRPDKEPNHFVTIHPYLVLFRMTCRCSRHKSLLFLTRRFPNPCPTYE